MAQNIKNAPGKLKQQAKNSINAAKNNAKNAAKNSSAEIYVKMNNGKIMSVLQFQ